MGCYKCALLARLAAHGDLLLAHRSGGIPAAARADATAGYGLCHPRFPQSSGTEPSPIGFDSNLCGSRGCLVRENSACDSRLSAALSCVSAATRRGGREAVGTGRSRLQDGVGSAYGCSFYSHSHRLLPHGASLARAVSQCGPSKDQRFLAGALAFFAGTSPRLFGLRDCCWADAQTPNNHVPFARLAACFGCPFVSGGLARAVHRCSILRFPVGNPAGLCCVVLFVARVGRVRENVPGRGFHTDRKSVV